MGECSEVSVIVGACVSVCIVNFLDCCVATTWPAVQSLVEEHCMIRERHVSGPPVERLGRQATISSG